jgi:hypothetical protein
MLVPGNLGERDGERAPRVSDRRSERQPDDSASCGGERIGEGARRSHANLTELKAYHRARTRAGAGERGIQHPVSGWVGVSSPQAPTTSSPSALDR